MVASPLRHLLLPPHSALSPCSGSLPSRPSSPITHSLYSILVCVVLICSLSLKNMFINTTASLVAGAGISGLRLESPAKLVRDQRRLSGSCRARTASNGFRTYCMKTWNPFTNTRYEALSYLPPLSEESIAKEVDYIMSKGWVPCLEFDKEARIHRSNSRMPGYYDGRYWTLWKLPMFGCSDAAQVLREVDECRNEYPGAYIRLIAFDGSRQCQSMSFVVHKPPSSSPSPSPAAA